MDFKEQLEKAIQRGARLGEARQQARQQQELDEEGFKRLYSQFRLQLSDRIETCLRQLPQHFPGFRFEALVGDRGWGAAINRDDLELDNGRRTNFFSRLEVTVRPYSHLHVLEITAKGTVRNKEIFNRSHFQLLTDVDLNTYSELIDRWVLEYAELYSARTRG